VTEGAGGRYRE